MKSKLRDLVVVLPWLFLPLLLLVGCSSVNQYKAPSAQSAASTSRGAAIELTRGDGVAFYGELLAVEPPLVYVLQAQSGAVIALNYATAQRVVIQNYRPHAKTLWWWSAAGMATTFTHGFFLILTLPAWTISAGLATFLTTLHGQTREPDPMWARYPQGMPPSMKERIGKRPPSHENRGKRGAPADPPPDEAPENRVF